MIFIILSTIAVFFIFAAFTVFARLWPLWCILLVWSVFHWSNSGGDTREAVVKAYNGAGVAIEATRIGNGLLTAEVNNASQARIHNLRFVCDLRKVSGWERVNSVAYLDYIPAHRVSTVTVAVPAAYAPDEQHCEINYDVERADAFAAAGRKVYDITTMVKTTIEQNDLVPTGSYAKDFTDADGNSRSATVSVARLDLGFAMRNASDVSIDTLKIECSFDIGDIDGPLVRQQGSNWLIWGDERFDTRRATTSAKDLYRTYLITVRQMVRPGDTIHVKHSFENIPYNTRTDTSFCKLVEADSSETGLSIDLYGIKKERATGGYK